MSDHFMMLWGTQELHGLVFRDLFGALRFWRAARC
jgi:hypothetical protein